MARVITDISMSLDGFIAGPNASPATPLGEGGDRLHQWLYDLESWRKPHHLEGGKTGPDSDILQEALKNVGAVLMGRRMFDEGEGPWGDNPPFHVPVLVVTHHARETVVKEGGTSYAFVTEGIQRALQLARMAAGERDVSVAGGASVIQQVLNAGLLDEIQIHLVPVLFGAGRRLFGELDLQQLELETTRVVVSPGVTHLKFRIPSVQGS